jgi:hypothetical protein
VLQTSQETIYVWGGIYMDPLLEAPVPLAGDVLRPGGELELVRARCIVRGPKERATVRCSASGRKPGPVASQAWQERLRACTRVREASPSRKDLRAIQDAWKAIVAGDDFRSKGMAWSVARYDPPAPTGNATLLEVAIIHLWKGPERVAKGCENVPPNQGCDPVAVETGRTITMERESVRYAYSRGPGGALARPFGGRAPLLHRVRIGQANSRGFVEDDPRLEIAGAENGIEDYRRRQIASLDAFAASADHPADVRAAIHINKGIAALHLKDLPTLRTEVEALRRLLSRTPVDRASLEVDNTLAYFDRVLAGEWLLEDPCAPGGAPIPPGPSPRDRKEKDR